MGNFCVTIKLFVVQTTCRDETWERATLSTVSLNQRQDMRFCCRLDLHRVQEFQSQTLLHFTRYCRVALSNVSACRDPIFIPSFCIIWINMNLSERLKLLLPPQSFNKKTRFKTPVICQSIYGLRYAIDSSFPSVNRRTQLDIFGLTPTEDRRAWEVLEMGYVHGLSWCSWC